MALNSEVEQKSKLVLRVDQDSDSDLQDLFDSVLKPDSKRPLQVPWHMRQLPKSFFNPPSTGSKSPSVSHSRENSADSAFGSAGGGGGPLVSHSRAHSSPASLQQTYAAGNGSAGPAAATNNAPSHRHAKQRSYDVTSCTVAMGDDLGPLPPGWGQARTPEGQIYYLNHNNCTTTWDDPRKPRQVEIITAQTTLTTQASPVSNPPTTNNTAQHLQRTPGANTILPSGGLWGSSLQQNMRLRSLQRERERLKQRQHEIRLQQEVMGRVIAVTNNMSVTGGDSGLDPFLSGLTEHSRQESGDSGLGMGLTHSYSMPHTPEDFLNNTDDNMDCTSESGGNNTMDAHDVLLSDNIDSTEDLVPSLQLGEEFSSDILEDVESLITSKQDNVLTWL